MASNKKLWDPWKMYDASAEELHAIKERAKMREALKAEWTKKYTDPWKSSHSGGSVFDPAVQRFISLKATQAEYFRGTFRSAVAATVLFVLPIGIMTFVTYRNKTAQEAMLRNGDVMYKDRREKFNY